MIMVRRAQAIIDPNFRFEDMGVGGLDKEFSSIFRRAFASRIFPPSLIEKLGIPHVKGEHVVRKREITALISDYSIFIRYSIVWSTWYG
jgi:hypothetical protein